MRDVSRTPHPCPVASVAASIGHHSREKKATAFTLLIDRDIAPAGLRPGSG